MWPHGEGHGSANHEFLFAQKYAPKSSIYGLTPRSFALKPLNLCPEKWLDLALRIISHITVVGVIFVARELGVGIGGFP